MKWTFIQSILRCNGTQVYDIVDDADVKVTATAQLAMMYIRKQNIFTEKCIYPYISLEDLRLDLLPHIREMATNNIEGIHSWENMNDEELMLIDMMIEK